MCRHKNFNKKETKARYIDPECSTLRENGNQV